MQLSTWRTAFPAGEGNHKTLTVTMSAHTRTSIYARFTQVLKEAGYRRKTLISTHKDKDVGLTLSHRMYTSFIPSATGSRSLMPNFLSVTLTSGTTSQPEEEEIVVNLTTEEEQQDNY